MKDHCLACSQAEKILDAPPLEDASEEHLRIINLRVALRQHRAEVETLLQRLELRYPERRPP